MISEAPPNWHPLIPELDSAGRTRLAVGTIPTSGLAPQPAKSRLLAEIASVGLPLGEVPAEGIRLRRLAEAARWVDGSRHSWIARERQVGRGDAGSGILFDIIERGEE